MSDLKILIVIDSLGAGGAEKSTEVLCHFLAQQKVKFDIICLNKKKVGVQQDMVAAGYNIEFIDRLSFINQVNFITNKIKNNNYNIVHSILFRSNIRVRLCRLKVKFFHLESLVNTTYSKSRQNDPKVNRIGLYSYWLLDRLSINRFVNHFHSVTETVKKHYIQKLNVPPSKISVIYRGRDSINIKSTLQLSEFGFSADSDFVIVTTGRHEYQKAQVQLLKAINLVHKQGFKNIKLLILGREGNSSAEMKEFINQNKLEKDICLAGYRSDVPSVLSLCHLFAFPSYYEGLGGALIEAQAAGLPIICNDIEVLREVVVDGENAAFFNSSDEHTIAEKILFLYNNNELRIQYSKKSRINFEDKFELNNINRKMLQLYTKLCTQ